MQVHIAKGMHSKKLQEHLQSLEEEVHLLEKLEHPNIVRYLVGAEGGRAGGQRVGWCSRRLAWCCLAGAERCTDQKEGCTAQVG